MDDTDALEGYDKKTRIQIEAMIEAERRASGAQIPGARAGEVAKSGEVRRPVRSRLHAGREPGLGADAGARSRTQGSTGAVWRDVPDDPTRVPGTAIAADGG